MRDFLRKWKLTDRKWNTSTETSSKNKGSQLQNEAILRDFLQKWQFVVHSHRSKTNKFCETSSSFGNIKKRNNKARLLSRWRADGFVPMRFVIFPSNLSRVLRLPRKSETKSYEVLHLYRKIILAKLTIWCSKKETVSGNLLPDLLTCLMEVSLVLCLYTRHASLQILFKSPTPSKGPRDMQLCRWNCFKTQTCGSFLARCWIHCACHVLFFWKAQLPKVLPRRALFSTTQLPKVLQQWFLFLLRNVLRAASVHNLWSPIRPDGSAPGALASLLFDPPEPQSIGKTQCFGLRTRSCALIFFLITSNYWLFLFWLFFFSDSSHLCFSMCPYCRKFDF